MRTFFKRISANCTNFEVSSLGLELQVSSLGVFDEVSVSISSRNFNQISDSEVTVSLSRRRCQITCFNTIRPEQGSFVRTSPPVITQKGR